MSSTRQTAMIFNLALIIFACSEKKGPEQTLSDFVNYRFSSGQTKERLLEMASGDFYQSISSMSDEDFENFSRRPIKKKRFKILKSQCDEQKCSISYFIKYDTFQNDNKVFSVETKKIANLKNIEGVWKIADVSNIKEFHRADKSINVISN